MNYPALSTLTARGLLADRLSGSQRYFQPAPGAGLEIKKPGEEVIVSGNEGDTIPCHTSEGPKEYEMTTMGLIAVCLFDGKQDGPKVIEMDGPGATATIPEECPHAIVFIGDADGSSACFSVDISKVKPNTKAKWEPDLADLLES